MTQNRYYVSDALPTTLSSGISNSVAQLTVASNTNFPSSFPFTLLLEWGTTNAEVVSATSLSSGTTYNVTRGCDGTTAVAHSISVPVAHGFSGQDFGEVAVHMAAAAGTTYPNTPSATSVPVHGITSAVAGISETQTITNKNLTSGTNTFPTFNQNTTGSAGSCTGNAATASNATAVGGITITGTPTAGQILVASSGTAAAWGTPVQSTYVATFTSASSTSSQTVTGATLVLALGSYLLEIEAAYEPAGTIGDTESFGLTGVTASAAALMGYVMQYSATTADTLSTLTNATALSATMYTSPTKAGATAEYGMLRIRGTITVSVAGTLQLVMTNNTGAGDEATLSGILLKAMPLGL